MTRTQIKTYFYLYQQHSRCYFEPFYILCNTLFDSILRIWKGVMHVLRVALRIAFLEGFNFPHAVFVNVKRVSSLLTIRSVFQNSNREHFLKVMMLMMPLYCRLTMMMQSGVFYWWDFEFPLWCSYADWSFEYICLFEMQCFVRSQQGRTVPRDPTDECNLSIYSEYANKCIHKWTEKSWNQWKYKKTGKRWNID